MALSDVYQVRLASEYLGRNMLNVFWYRHDAVGSGSAASQLLTAFNTNVALAVRDITNSQVLNYTTTVVNYRDPTNDNAEGVAGDGLVTGEANMVPRYALSMRSAWPGPGTRRAYKRFSGITEEAMDNQVVSAAYAARVSLLATRLGTTLLQGGHLFAPIIVGTPKVYFTNPPIKGNATGWAFLGWGTQNSRS